MVMLSSYLISFYCPVTSQFNQGELDNVYHQKGDDIFS